MTEDIRVYVITNVGTATEKWEMTLVPATKQRRLNLWAKAQERSEGWMIRQDGLLLET
jgi:hypothetical protein